MAPITLPCDVNRDAEIDALFESLPEHWVGFDIIVHSVAYAPRGQLEGDYLVGVIREGFRTAREISYYSFGPLAWAGRSILRGKC